MTIFVMLMMVISMVMLVVGVVMCWWCDGDDGYGSRIDGNGIAMKYKSQY